MDGPDNETKIHWLKEVLFKEAESLFDDAVGSGEFNAEKHERVAIAWNQLRKSNSSQAKFFKETMDLAQ